MHCTPFHHNPLRPVIPTAEQLRNPSFLSQKLCRRKAALEGPGCQTALPSFRGSQACPGNCFSRSGDGFMLICSFPCDESHKPLALSDPRESHGLVRGLGEENGQQNSWLSESLHTFHPAGHLFIISASQWDPQGHFTSEEATCAHNCLGVQYANFTHVFWPLRRLLTAKEPQAGPGSTNPPALTQHTRGLNRLPQRP